MATALTYRFRTLAIITGATAVVGSLLVWWWFGRGTYSPDAEGLPTSQVFLQAWTVVAQILIYLTAVFAAGAVATRILSVAKGWDDDADGDEDAYGDDGDDSDDPILPNP